LKVIICDGCKDPKKEIYFDAGHQFCEDCYHESGLYKMTPLEEDWGVKMGRQLAKFDAFLVFDYESFDYYDEKSKRYAKEINDVFKKLGVDGIKAFADHNENNAIIGFKKC